jgi:hypothetical protein
MQNHERRRATKQLEKFETCENIFICLGADNRRSF